MRSKLLLLGLDKLLQRDVRTDVGVVLGQVNVDHGSDLVRLHHILLVERDSFVARIGIVQHGLIDVVSHIHSHRIPAGVLEVNNHQFLVNSVLHEDVALEHIIVAKDVRVSIVTRDHGLPVLLVALEQVLLLNVLHDFEVLGPVLILSGIELVLQALFDAWQVLDEVWSPLVEDSMDKELLRVERHDLFKLLSDSREVVVKDHLSVSLVDVRVPHLPDTDGSSFKEALDSIVVALVEESRACAIVRLGLKDELLHIPVRQLLDKPSK